RDAGTAGDIFGGRAVQAQFGELLERRVQDLVAPNLFRLARARRPRSLPRGGSRAYEVTPPGAIGCTGDRRRRHRPAPAPAHPRVENPEWQLDLAWLTRCYALVRGRADSTSERVCASPAELCRDLEGSGREHVGFELSSGVLVGPASPSITPAK